MKLVDKLIELYEEAIPLKVPVIRRDVLESVWPDKLKPDSYRKALERQSLFIIMVFHLHTRSILGETKTNLSNLAKGYDRVTLYKKYKDIVADAKLAMKTEDIF